VRRICAGAASGACAAVIRSFARRNHQSMSAGVLPLKCHPAASRRRLPCPQDPLADLVPGEWYLGVPCAHCDEMVLFIPDISCGKWDLSVGPAAPKEKFQWVCLRGHLTSFRLGDLQQFQWRPRLNSVNADQAERNRRHPNRARAPSDFRDDSCRTAVERSRYAITLVTTHEFLDRSPRAAALPKRYRRPPQPGNRGLLPEKGSAGTGELGAGLRCAVPKPTNRL
jgi:hypothetical protein